jgi:hypothetical protein
MLVTAPVIARLTARSRFAINRAIKRGEFGPVHHSSGRALRVELSYVEQALGPFPPERLRAAGLRVRAAEAA